MEGDIKKLLELAQSAGSITNKQKEVIINKARKVGCDIDELEMILETIPIIEENTKPISRIKKCPHCGATLSDFILQCPECGYVFSNESQVSERNRNYIAELHANLQMIENRPAKNKTEREFDIILEQNKQKEKADLIKSFSVPNTKEALIQALLGCYSAYQGTRASYYDIAQGKVDLKQAWLGKAKEFYLLLQSQPVIDSQTAAIIEKYKTLFDDVAKSSSHRRFIIIAIIVLLAILFVTDALSF